MDPVRLKVLKAEIRAQQEKIEEVFDLLEERLKTLVWEHPAQVESLAYQLHNLYNAAEDLMKLVASAFENSVTDLQLRPLLKRDIAAFLKALESAEEG